MQGENPLLQTFAAPRQRQGFLPLQIITYVNSQISSLATIAAGISQNIS